MAHWFDPCVDVAHRILGDLDEAADVARHTLLGSRPPTLGPRRASSAGTWALRAARDEALTRLNRRRRPDGSPDAGGGAAGVDGAGDPDGDAVMRAAFAALGASDASVLDLHLRHGFEVTDVAEALGVSANEAHQLLFRLKRRLGAAVRAWALWPDAEADDRACPELVAALAADGVTAFGADAVQTTGQHARSCEACQSRQRSPRSAEAVFAAVPAVSVPALREAALAAVPDAPPASAAPEPAPAPPVTGTGSGAGPGSPSAPASPPDGAGPPASPPPLPTRVPGRSRRPNGNAGPPERVAAGLGADPHHRPPGEILATPWDPQPPSGSPTNGDGPAGNGRAVADTGPTPAVDGPPESAAGPAPAAAVSTAPPAPPAPGPALRPGPRGNGDAGPVPTATPARPGPAGEHGFASHYRRPSRRTDGRQVVGVGLALLLVLAMSLAVVAFTRDRGPSEAGDDPTSTSTATTGESGGGDSPPAAERPPTVPSTAEPDGGEPDGGGAAAPADAPEIDRFEATEQGLGTPCGQFQLRITLVWQSTGATTAQLDGPGAPTDPLRPSGRVTVCRDPGPPVTYTLTVDGAGGTTFRTTTA